MFDIPVTASKAWKRIKGFFSRAMRWVKGISPVVAKVAPSILPGPYGAVVASIANTIDTLSVGVSGTALGGALSVLSDGKIVYSAAQGDKFVAQVQYRLLSSNYTDE